MPKVRRFQYGVPALPQAHVSTYKEGVIFEGGRFGGALAVYGHPPLKGCRLVSSA